MTELTIEELRERLRLGHNLVSDSLALYGHLMTKDVHEDITKLQKILDETEEMIEEETRKPEEPKIVISVDASITENPGGKAAIGMVIDFPPAMRMKRLEVAMPTPSKTINAAEYDAVFEGIRTLFNHVNAPAYKVLVRSDSKLVVEQLLGNWSVNEPTLKTKCQSIKELINELPIPIEIEWHRRNSTPSLTTANFLAQDYLGVRRH